MATFSGSAQTETAEHGGGNDHAWPDFKALDPKQISVPTGLQGIPTCTWGTKVYGDQQEIIYKNRQVAIVLNDKLDVGVDRTETIEAANYIYVKGGRLVEITPTETLQVNGNRMVWVHGQDTEHYLVHREIQEPVERIEHSEKSMEYGSSKAEALGAAFETKGFAAEIKNIKAEQQFFNSTNAGIENRLKPLQSGIETMEAHIGALKLACKVKLNALINFATSSPYS